MSIHTLKAGLFLFLGLLVGCSSDGSGNTSAGAREIVPRNASDCATDRCGEYPDDDCSDWYMRDGYSNECMLDCPRGGPTGPIAVRFECYEVHIVSCKELSNVVVEFEDGEHYKYDGLEGHYGTFGAGEKEIVGVWVKAGNNASGDGPGYGMRFDSDADCDDGGTGGTGGNDGMGGAGGAGASAGAGGMGGTGGDDCHCSCDDGDSDADSDSDRHGYSDESDSDSDRDCDCDSACDCKVDLECPHGGKFGNIEVEFECNEAHIASCKDLSNVVIEFEEGEHRKYDDLDGHCVTLGVGEREIAGVWVKAGNNKSGDGPGYGERFDSDADCDGTGGTGGAGGVGGAPGCMMNEDCDPGEICVDNVCVPDLECINDEGCNVGEVCVENMCVSDPDIFCNEGLCLMDSALRAQCVETFLTCLAGEPINAEECVLAALLICNEPGCTMNEDCDPGEICVDNVCVPEVECNVDGDCGMDEVCVANTCVGDPDLFCNEGLCLTNDTARDNCIEAFLVCVVAEPANEGECLLLGLAQCNVDCLVDEDCDAGETCVDNVCIAPAVSFAADIQPYFEPGLADCVECHSGGSGFKGVNLDSYDNILAGGDSGPLVVPFDSTDPTAILIPKLEANHNNGPDDAGFVVILSQWIDEGALNN